MMTYFAANGLWTLANSAAFLRYRRAVRGPRRTQEQILLRFLRLNAQSEYGKRYQYAHLKSIRDFQKAVPVVDYDGLEPWIERIRLGRPGVLTEEPVLFFEKTSGSSAEAKYVPYTASLLREFRSALGAWMFDLFTGRPKLLAGAQYWSISPLARAKEVTPGGIRVGIDNDAEYFGPIARWSLGRVLAVPGSVKLEPDLEACRRTTLDYLVQCRNLRFISVWNPSFLVLLVDRLPGGIRPLDCWPNLRLISCWTSASSARFLTDLQEKFPNVEIQGKGLLATEGIVSFPELGRAAPSPAITSHFLEFLDEQGRARLVDELEVGRRYRVLLTTGGGLARYDLGDEVEVVAPGAIEFVGRASCVSDMCGEKLSETFAGKILEEVVLTHRLRGLIMLAPEWSRPPRYMLFVESEAATAIAQEVERGLRRSVQYDYCRRLGQLGPVEGVPVTNGAERYGRSCETLGQRAGNVKPAYLRPEFGWRERLAQPSANRPPLREAAHAG